MTIGRDIRRYVSVPSTNDTARELARAGAGHGTVVVAREQTRGRGTKGRAWSSPAGLGLYASFILKPGDSPQMRAALPLLPLAAGLAAADAVFTASGVEARLKWPNDLVHAKLKLAGILSEASFRGGAPAFAVVGVGINVNQEGADFGGELAGMATSLRLITGRTHDSERLLGALCLSLESWYNSLGREGGAAIVRAAGERMAFAPGAHLHIARGSGVLTGTYRGLSADGRLRLEAGGREETLSSEDIASLDWD